MSTEHAPTEGWTWLFNSRKDHYFRAGKSLCRRYLLLGDGDLREGPGTGFNDCSACARALAAERAQHEVLG